MTNKYLKRGSNTMNERNVNLNNGEMTLPSLEWQSQKGGRNRELMRMCEDKISSESQVDV